MTNGKIALIGFGISNKAVYENLKCYGYPFLVRSSKEIRVPSGVELVFGDSYLDTEEDIIFRSPSCMPYKIKGKGHITSEAAFALSHISCGKIGVTGSDGKTTASTLISKMLCAEGKNAFLCGNNGNPVINYMGKVRKSDFLVCELSSFQLTDLAPALDCGVVTNLTPNHLDIHSSYEEYVYAKSNILKNARRGVINFDCSESRRLSAYLKGGGELTFVSLSYENVRGINNARLVYVRDGYIFCDGERIIPLSDIRLRGEFNLINVCLAIGAVYGHVSAENIKNAVRDFYGVSHRMEKIASKDGIDFYDSSIDSTPSRTLATLSAFDKEKTIVILGGYDKNLSYDCLGDGMEKMKYAVICGANSEKIYGAIKNRCDCALCDSFTESVKIAYRMAEKGDSVVLSPASASYDAFENYKEKSKKYIEIVRGL